VLSSLVDYIGKQPISQGHINEIKQTFMSKEDLIKLRQQSAEAGFDAREMQEFKRFLTEMKDDVEELRHDLNK
jgi:hypothetical protein